MSSARDFDAELSKATRDEEEAPPITFTLGGREWTADSIPERLRLKLLGATAPARRAQVMDQILDRLVIPDQRVEFNLFTLEGFPEEKEQTPIKTGKNKGQMRSKIVRHAFSAPDLELLYRIVAYVVTEQTGRPTMPPSP